MENSFKIIENQSPYFVKFHLDTLKEIQKLVLEYLNNNSSATIYEERNLKTYQHLNLNHNISKQIIDMFAFSNLYTLDIERVALFVTPPYSGGGIHKDGPTYSPHHTSFNIPIEIQDDACKTKWFEDNIFTDNDKKELIVNSYSRNIHRDFVNTEHFKSSAETIMTNDCAMILNTEKWHTFYNNGPNKRTILTLRIVKDERKNHTFSSVVENLINKKYLVN